VPTKDAPSPQLAADTEHVPLRREVTLQHVGRHILELIGAERRLARRHQRIVVDVGGVDLHVDISRPGTEGVGDHDGRGVRLLAGRAARRPDAHAPGRRAEVDKGRQGVHAQRFPRLRVAEEPGDIDQDAVEERRRFRWLHPQIVDVGVEALDPDLRHAGPNATHE
jgi:hypothetical protein